MVSIFTTRFSIVNWGHYQEEKDVFLHYSPLYEASIVGGLIMGSFHHMIHHQDALRMRVFHLGEMSPKLVLRVK